MLVTTALKEKNDLALGTWRMLVAKVQAFEKEQGREAEEAEFLRLVTSELKRREEAAGLYTQGGRPELAAHESAEAALLQTLLPARLSEAEVESKVAEYLATGAFVAKDMGQVIKALKEQLGVSVDGAVLAKVVKLKLGA